MVQVLPKSEGKGHALLLWGMPKPWDITCLELLMGLTATPQALVKLLFQENIFEPRVIPCQPASLLHWLLGHLPVRELQGRFSSPGCRAELSVSLQDSSSPRHVPLWDTQTPSTILLKVGTAQQWLQDSKANLRQRACCSSKKQDLFFLLSKPDQKLCIYTEIKSSALHLPN